MTSTISLKTSRLNDYFAQNTSSRTSILDAHQFIIANKGNFTTAKHLKKVAFLTKTSGEPEPTVFHSIFEPPAPRNENDPWSNKVIQCVLTGLEDTITVNKINHNALSKTITGTPRFSARRIIEADSIEAIKNLQPLQDDEEIEFTLSQARNSIFIQPQYIPVLTGGFSILDGSLLFEAAKVLKETMQEEEEMIEIITEQTEIYNPPTPETSETAGELAERLESIAARQKALNGRYQKLAEDCGLDLVLFLFNFEAANSMTFEDVTNDEGAAEMALEVLAAKSSATFTMKDGVIQKVQQVSSVWLY